MPRKPPTAWNNHVAKVRKAHPNLSFKNVLIKAKGLYKPKSKK